MDSDLGIGVDAGGTVEVLASDAATKLWCPARRRRGHTGPKTRQTEGPRTEAQGDHSPQVRPRRLSPDWCEPSTLRPLACVCAATAHAHLAGSPQQTTASSKKAKQTLPDSVVGGDSVLGGCDCRALRKRFVVPSGALPMPVSDRLISPQILRRVPRPELRQYRSKPAAQLLPKGPKRAVARR
jgi:hypothetical protein